MNSNEAICQAVDIIIGQRLSEIKYDQTVVCTIVDNSDAENGHYIVSNDANLKFDAYSENTDYKTETQVYVLIPQGDYSSKKQITGKYDTSKIKEYEEKMAAITSPLDQVSLTGDGFFTYKDSTGIAIKTPASGETERKILITTINNITLPAGNVLSISADFKGVMTAADSIDGSIVAGTYGLIARVSIKDSSNTIRTHDLYLRSDKDMIGNVYKFHIPAKQSQTYTLPLTETEEEITEIQLFLFHDNTFKTVYGNTYVNNDNFNNIEVSNIKLGYSFSMIGVEQNTVKITTSDTTLKYGTNSNIDKVLNLTYFNKTENNKYIGFSDGKFDMSKAKTGNQEDEQKYYWIEWLSSTQSGVWKRIEIASDSDNLEESLTTVPVQCEGAKLTTSFKAQVYCNGQMYESNTIAFTNSDLLANAEKGYLHLDFILEHDEGSQDAYPCYGEDNTLINSADGQRSRKLKFSYTSSVGAVLDNNLLKDCTACWYLPLGATMLTAAASRSYGSEDDSYRFAVEGEAGNNVEEKYRIDGYRCYSIKLDDSEMPNTFPYRIKNLYVSNFQNNTILFKLFDTNGNCYEAQKSFVFSTQGIFGTKYSLIIQEENNLPAFTNKKSGEEDFDYNLIAKLYDPDNKALSNEIELIYTLNNITNTNNDIYYNIATAKTSITWPLNGNNEHQLFLEKKYPIAWRSNADYYYQGPNSIIYNEAGSNPAYFKDALKLFNQNNEQESNISWNVVFCDASGKEYKPTENQTSIATLQKYLPAVVKDKNNNYYLQPPQIYCDVEGIYICLTARKNSALLWVQPILISKNQYNNTALNEWDGSLIVDEDQNYIMSSSVTAGVKHANNTFSGVVMGEVGRKNGDIFESQTGLFGYSEGKQAFGFRDNGTAFIGIDSQGRIEFDGSGGVIKSADEAGMTINLSEGSIHANNFKLTSNRITLNSNPNENDYYFAIGDKNTKRNFIGLTNEGELIFRPSSFELTAMGGTNLLLNSAPRAIRDSDVIYWDDGWDESSSTIRIINTNDKPSIFEIVRDGNSENILYGLISNIVYLKAKTNYTFSAEVQSDAPITQIQVSVTQGSNVILTDNWTANDENSELNSETTDWQFISTTFKMPTNSEYDPKQAVSFHILVKTSGESFQLWHPQLEKGIYATSWNRAPEDETKYLKDENLAYDKFLDDVEVFNRLTDDGRIQGIFINKDDKQLYINANYIRTGVLQSQNFEGTIEPDYKYIKATSGMIWDLNTGVLGTRHFSLFANNDNFILNSDPDENEEYYLKLAGADGSKITFNKDGRLDIIASSFSLTGLPTGPNLLTETAPTRSGIVYTTEQGKEDSLVPNIWIAYNNLSKVVSFQSENFHSHYPAYFPNGIPAEMSRDDNGIKCSYGNTSINDFGSSSGWGMYQNVYLIPGETYVFSGYITAQGRTNKSGSWSSGCKREIRVYAKDLNTNSSLASKGFYFDIPETDKANCPYEYCQFLFTVPSSSKGFIRLGIYSNKSATDASGNTISLSSVNTNTDTNEGGKFWVYYPKLEKGSEPTKWVDKDYRSGSLETQFQELTQNGKIKGIYYQNNDLFINADYIKTGKLNADFISGGTINANDVIITNLDASKITTGKLNASYITGSMGSAVTIGGWSIGDTSLYSSLTDSNGSKSFMGLYYANQGDNWTELYGMLSRDWRILIGLEPGENIGLDSKKEAFGITSGGALCATSGTFKNYITAQYLKTRRGIFTGGEDVQYDVSGYPALGSRIGGQTYIKQIVGDSMIGSWTISSDNLSMKSSGQKDNKIYNITVHATRGLTILIESQSGGAPIVSKTISWEQIAEKLA